MTGRRVRRLVTGPALGIRPGGVLRVEPLPTIDPCEPLRNALADARARLAATDCSELAAALAQAEVDLKDAEAALTAELDRRRQLRDAAMAARGQAQAAASALTNAQAALAQAQAAIQSAVTDYFARSDTPDSDIPEALSFDTPPEDDRRAWVEMDLGQGVSAWLRIGTYEPSLQRDMTARVASYLRRRVLLRSQIAAVAKAQGQVAAAQTALNQARAAYAAADAAWSGLAPADLAYRAALAERDALRTAYDACVRLRSELERDVQRLEMEYDHCVGQSQARERARAARDAIEAGESVVADAGRALADAQAAAEEAQSGRIRRDIRAATTAEAKAREHQAAAAERLADAEALLDQGASEAARAAADEAAELAAQARTQAARATQRAAEAEQRARELAERRAKKAAAEQAQKEARERKRAQQRMADEAARKRAALRWMISQAIESSRSELSDEDIRELQQLLRKLESLGEDLDDLVGRFAAGVDESPELRRLLQQARKRLQDVVKQLGALADRVDGLVALYDKYKAAMGHIDTLLSEDDSTEGRARKFGAILGLVSEAVGKLTDAFPILSFVGGYLTFLTDAYFAAIEALPARFREIYRSHIDAVLSGRTAFSLYASGKSVDEIAERLFGSYATTQAAHAPELFMAAARAAVHAAITREAQKLLAD